jgi:hypothetical protein
MATNRTKRQPTPKPSTPKTPPVETPQPSAPDVGQLDSNSETARLHMLQTGVRQLLEMYGYDLQVQLHPGQPIFHGGSIITPTQAQIIYVKVR